MSMKQKSLVEKTHDVVMDGRKGGHGDHRRRAGGVDVTFGSVFFWQLGGYSRVPLNYRDRNWQKYLSIAHSFSYGYSM